MGLSVLWGSQLWETCELLRPFSSPPATFLASRCPDPVDRRSHPSPWPFREPDFTLGGTASHGRHGRGRTCAPTVSQACGLPGCSDTGSHWGRKPKTGPL